MTFKIPMLSNSSNKTSFSFTCAFIAFNVITLWLVLFIVCPIFGITSIPDFDGSSSMLYLTPILTLYFGGKALEKNKSTNNE